MPLERKQLGRYQLTHLLGSGGMGEVYLAEDPLIGRRVAIKIVRSELNTSSEEKNQEATRLFQREMRTITRLDHPHILPLLDYGEERDNVLLTIYMVMPYRPEGSLSDWLKKHAEQKLSPSQTAHIIRQAAEALHHAHKNQVIHQDVKPSNFLLRIREDQPEEPDVLLTDFGIARLITATSTISQSIRGTPIYMAPEQWEGHPVPASDQYALAIMAYQMLTGSPPFQGSPAQIMRQHLMTIPPSLSALNPSIPKALDEVIQIALHKEPGKRFGSINAFARAFLQSIGESTSITGSIQALPPQPSAEHPLFLSQPQSAAAGTPVHPLSLTEADAPAPQPSGGMPAIPQALKNNTPVLPLEKNESATLLQAADTVLPGRKALEAANTPEPAFEHVQAPPPPPETLLPISGTVRPVTSTPAPSAHKNRMLALALLLVALLILGSSGIFLLSSAISHQNSVNATATIVTGKQLKAQATARATARIATATTGAYASATAQIYASSTAITAATATLEASYPNPYPYTANSHAALAFYDPLTSDTHSWNDSSTKDGSCQFSNGAYHVKDLSSGNYYTCYPTEVYANNFVLQVRLSILSGDCAGITFRSLSDKYYLFEICQDGTFSLNSNTTDGTGNKVLVSQGSPAIKKGLKQTNTLAIVAIGATLTVYINHTNVYNTTDKTNSEGSIGFTAQFVNNATEATFNDVMLWT